MKIYLVRHGETIENVQKINQGHLQGHLSEKGKKQARETAERLKKEKIDLVYCSDLKRTRDTAAEIMNVIKAPIHYTKELRELDIGVFSGTPYGTIKEYLQKNNIQDFPNFKPEGGESLNEFQKRLCDFCNKLLIKHKTENILLITHGGVIKNLLLHLLKLDDKYHKHISPEHASIIIVEVGEGGVISVSPDINSELSRIKY